MNNVTLGRLLTIYQCDIVNFSDHFNRVESFILYILVKRSANCIVTSHDYIVMFCKGIVRYNIIVFSKLGELY